jgi:hypothetical protein
MKAQRTEREDISIAVCWSLGVMECRSDASRQVCKLGAKEKMNVEHSTLNIELRMTLYP